MAGCFLAPHGWLFLMALQNILNELFKWGVLKFFWICPYSQTTYQQVCHVTIVILVGFTVPLAFLITIECF